MNVGIITGVGKAEKFERRTGFDITVASEIMVGEPTLFIFNFVSCCCYY